MTLQNDFDASIKNGTKTKLIGAVLGSAGAFLAVGACTLTAGLTVAAAGPVLAILGGAAVASAAIGTNIYMDGVQHQVFMKEAYKSELQSGVIKEKPSIFERINSLRKSFTSNDSDCQTKLKI